MPNILNFQKKRWIFSKSVGFLYLNVVLIFGVLLIIGCGGGGGDNDNGSVSLTSITVTPATPSVSLGQTQAFTATGSYSDGSTQNLTSSVTWASTEITVATISSSGVATSVGQGSTVISATSGGITGSTTLTVNATTLVSIAVTPASPTLYYEGATRQFTATGTYTNSSTQDITASVTWSSSNNGVATISSDGFSRVVSTSGNTVITATQGAVQGNTTLSIQTSTVNGQISIPDSDMGWRPSLYWPDYKVRVEGTDIDADVIATSATTGTFSLTGVPRGAVTLIFEEGSVNISGSYVSQDAFTQSSKRVAVNVNADTINGVGFNFVYHWAELENYPPEWGTSTPWQAQFVSDQIAFVMFRVDNNPDPETIELYRTLDRGENWSLIGEWHNGVDDPYPAYWLDFYFLDQDHGVVLYTVSCIPCGACGAGYYYTTDGGNNWNTIALPLTPTGYDIIPRAYARIGSTHLIMGGKVGCGVQGYNAGFYDAIWESENSGANWDLKWNSAINSSGSFIGLDANSVGEAVGFRGGTVQEFLLRDDQGNWTSGGNTEGIYNNSRDIAMVDDTAWILSYGGAASNGIYQSTDTGQTWNKISDALTQDFDFANTKKGFQQAGGPAMVTYDGGLTWLYQSAGGAVWPGDMDIWAFDKTHAAWAEGGYSDPNGEAQLFTYVEPSDPEFELLPSSSITDSNISAGATNVLMTSYRLYNLSSATIIVDSINLQASGSGNDAADITDVDLWLDRNEDGAIDPSDTLLDSSNYSSDDGTISLLIGHLYPLEQFIPVQVIISYNLEPNIASNSTFRFSLDLGEVDAIETDTNTVVLPGSPTGYVLTSRTITVSP